MLLKDPPTAHACRVLPTATHIAPVYATLVRLEGQIMSKRPGIFPTFFISGFECSTFLWKDQGRRNLIAETQHDKFATKDYELLRRLGIAVSREGIPWPLVDNKGVYDFSIIDPMIQAMNEQQILPIWD